MSNTYSPTSYILCMRMGSYRLCLWQSQGVFTHTYTCTHTHTHAQTHIHKHTHSKLLIKDQKVRSTKDLPQEQFKELVSDLEVRLINCNPSLEPDLFPGISRHLHTHTQNWTEKVKSEETTGGDDDSLPPVRRGGVVSGKPAVCQ